jgi:hypothetical protein
MATGSSRYNPVFVNFFIAFLFFALEVVLLTALDIATSYFQAQMIIATSLFGMLVGAVVPVVLKPKRCISYVVPVLQFIWILPLISIGLVLISFSFPLLTVLGLIGIFAPLGFVLSVMYWLSSPWFLYAGELFGAVAGLVFFLLAVPHIRSENALILLTTISVAGVVILLRKHLRVQDIILFAAIMVASVAGLVSNIFNHHVNFLLDTVCTPEHMSGYATNKVACLDELGIPYQIELSLGSLQNRIDVFKTGTDKYYFTAYSGTRNDIIQPFPAAYYDQDARLPAGIIANPKTLILGAGAEGVAKVAKSIGATDITVVEYNPAVLDIWNESLPYAETAFRPLANTNVVQGDARLFVQGTTDSYDIITLMNTHRSLHAAQFGHPDFLHTKQALIDYLAVLSPEGFLSIEELSLKNDGDTDIARRIYTAVEALKSMGINNPYDNILVYQWVGAQKGERIPSDPNLVYTQILVKRNAWSVEQLVSFRKWSAQSQDTDQFQKPSNMTFYRPVWYPDTGIATSVSSSSIIAQPFFDDGHSLTSLTDRAPFSVDLGAQDKYVLHIFLGIGFVALVLFLCWYWYRRKAVEFSHGWAWYFFVIGMSYMAIEMFLLLWLQLYIGSIFITMVVVIGGLFVSSALASLYYRTKEFSFLNLVTRITLTLVVLLLIYVMPWPGFSVDVKIMMSAVITLVIGVLLAPFFPYPLQVLEAQSKQLTPVLVGLNGVAMALAVPLSIIVAAYFSFTALLAFTAGLYFVALVFYYTSCKERVVF